MNCRESADCRIDNAAIPWLKDYKVATWWMGDNTLLDWTEEDFDRQARLFKQQGFTAVDPSNFHFRWSWMEGDKENLMRQARRTAEAAHRHGLKYIEHHSAVVMHRASLRPATEAELMEHLNAVGKDMRFDIKRHPAFVKGFLHGVVYQGRNLDEMSQLDLGTGLRAGTWYTGGHAMALCSNNPDFRKMSFGYLEELYELGVDGILPDDVMFYPRLNSCGCPHCREKFKRFSGYDLPNTPEDVAKFLRDYEDPRMKAWIRFRRDSVADYQREVTRQMRASGRNVMRPFYHSSATTTGNNLTGGSIDQAAPYCSLLFTEVIWPTILPYSWERVGSELLQRLALGRRHDMPVQAQFYPLDDDAASFCIAFAALLEQGYLGTTYHAQSGQPPTQFERVFDLIKSRSELFAAPQSMSRVKLLFSHVTRDNYGGMEDAFYIWEWAGWCEAMLRGRIPFDVILHEDIEEDAWLEETDLLILPNMACMSPRQAEQIRRFVAAGGKLIATHESSLYDAQGNALRDFQLGDVFGLQYVRTEGRIHPDFVVRCPEFFGGTGLATKYLQNVEPVVIARALPGTELLAKVSFDNAEEVTPAIVRRRFGEGEVIVFMGKPGCENYVEGASTDAHGWELAWLCRGRRNPVMRKAMIEAITSMTRGRETLTVEGAPDGLLVRGHRTNDSTVVHVLNATGMLLEPGMDFRKERVESAPTPNIAPASTDALRDSISGGTYPKAKFPPISGTVTIGVRAPSCSKAEAHIPGVKKPRALAVRRSAGMTCVDVPGELCGRYVVIVFHNEA